MTIFASLAPAQTRSKSQRTHTGEGRALEVFKGSIDHHGECEGANRDSFKGTPAVRVRLKPSFIQHSSFRPRQKSARRSKNSFLPPQLHPTTPIRVNGSLPVSCLIYALSPAFIVRHRPVHRVVPGPTWAKQQWTLWVLLRTT